MDFWLLSNPSRPTQLAAWCETPECSQEYEGSVVLLQIDQMVSDRMCAKSDRMHAFYIVLTMEILMIM